MRLPGRLIRAPLRPDRASLASFVSLRWAALPIIDRRWTAPLSAIALGFGLFVGVAIGPGTSAGLGTERAIVVELPPPDDTQTASVPPDGGGDPRQGSGSSGNEGSGAADPPPASSPQSTLDTPSTTPPPISSAPPILTPPPVTTTPSDETTTTEDEPVEETSTTLTGTVVHLNPAAASYAITTDDRRLLAVHTHKPPAVGREVEVEATELPNGTYFESGRRDEGGRRGRVAFDGTVSFRDPVAGTYTVSGPGVSLLVRGGAQRTPPDVGDLVEVQARVADGAEPLTPSTPGQQGCGGAPKPPKPPETSLEQTGLKPSESERATATDIEAIVEGVCRSERRLIVSADDVRESGQDISIVVPKRLKLAGFEPGQVVKLSARIGEAKTFTLSTVAGDEGKHGAEDEKLVQPPSGTDDG